MKKKVFEYKFPDNRTATEYLNKYHWKYIGRKGVFRKYHCYKAVSVWRSLDGICGYTNRDNIDEYFVNLYLDGYVSIYVEGVSSLVRLSSFPKDVWSSYQSYKTLIGIMDILRCNIPNHTLKVERQGVYIIIINEDELVFHRPQNLYEYAQKVGITSTSDSYEVLIKDIKC